MNNIYTEIQVAYTMKLQENWLNIRLKYKITG